MRAAVAAGFILVFFSATLLAHDRDGRYAASSQERQQFYKGLTDRAGTSCCSDADGTEVDDWDPAGNRVLIKGEWLDIPESAQLNIRNRYGAARAWVYTGPDGKTIVRCFIAGNLT